MEIAGQGRLRVECQTNDTAPGERREGCVCSHVNGFTGGRDRLPTWSQSQSISGTAAGPTTDDVIKEDVDNCLISHLDLAALFFFRSANLAPTSFSTYLVCPER